MTCREPAISPRILTLADLPAALELSSAAGWNQTADDWSMLIGLAPESCFGIDCDDRLVAATTLLCYGRKLAWLGMVLTLPEYRGRGFARALVSHALAFADCQAIEAVKLDATDQGLPLYRTLGFREEQPIERWVAKSVVVSPCKATGNMLTAEEIIRYDGRALGVSRPALLQSLMQRTPALSVPDGFLLSRPGAHASYLGPCVAANEDSARQLIEQCLCQDGKSWFWDLLPANQRAAAMAKDIGFTRARQLMRMVRGTDTVSAWNTQWAIAGFEMG